MTRATASRFPVRGNKDSFMTYKTTGTSKFGKGSPRHKEHNAPGSEKNPYGKRPSKAELLERMKANAKKPAK